MPRRRWRRGTRQAATAQGNGHEQEQEQQQQAAPPPILQSLASTAASNETPAEEGNNDQDNYHHQQQHEQQEQDLEQPIFPTSILLGLATKAATAAKEAQEAARAAANAAAEAAQASQTAADAAAAMADALQQLHLDEENVAAAARLVALQKERRQEAWEVCVSTRVLASFMTTRDLCTLSTCSHLHLPVRRQIVRVVVKTFTPSLLSSMAAGNLAEVDFLSVEFSFCGFKNRTIYRKAVTRAFRQMHNLTSLFLRFQVRSVLYSIFDGLGVEGRRRLTLLEIGIASEGLVPELPPSYYNTFLQGLTSLRFFILKCEFGDCKEAIRQGNFPQLQYFQMKGRTTEDEMDDFQQLMIRGSLRHVYMLDIAMGNCMGDAAEPLEKLLPLLPRLKMLAISGNSLLNAAGVDRLFARAAEEECSVIIPGRSSV
jgi:hypothetical protein